MSDAEGHRARKRSSKGHKEDSSDRGDVFENAEDASSYDENDDDEVSTSGGEDYSDFESDDDKNESEESEKSTSKRSGKRRVYEKDEHNRDEESLKFRTIMREELHEKHAGHQENLCDCAVLTLRT